MCLKVNKTNTKQGAEQSKQHAMLVFPQETLEEFQKVVTYVWGGTGWMNSYSENQTFIVRLFILLNFEPRDHITYSKK